MSENQDNKDSDTESEQSGPRQWLPSGGLGRGVTVESPSGEDEWQVVDQVGGSDEEESEEEGKQAADEGGANEEGGGESESDGDSQYEDAEDRHDDQEGARGGRQVPEEDMYVCPRSGVRERTWRLSQRDQTCPVRGCPVITRNVRRHMMQEHLSPMFGIEWTRDQLRHPGFQNYRGDMVMILASWLMRTSTPRYGDFVEFLRERVRLPENCILPGKYMTGFRTLCSHMGWETFHTYDIRDIRSPVLVLHWRVMARLIHLLTPSQQIQVATDVFNPRRPVPYADVRSRNMIFMGAADLNVIPAGSEGDRRVVVRASGVMTVAACCLSNQGSNSEVALAGSATEGTRDAGTQTTSPGVQEVGVQFQSTSDLVSVCGNLELPALGNEEELPQPVLVTLSFRGRRLRVRVRSMAQIRTIVTVRYGIPAPRLLVEGVEIDVTVALGDLSLETTFEVAEPDE